MRIRLLEWFWNRLRNQIAIAMRRVSFLICPRGKGGSSHSLLKLFITTSELPTSPLPIGCFASRSHPAPHLPRCSPPRTTAHRPPPCGDLVAHQCDLLRHHDHPRSPPKTPFFVGSSQSIVHATKTKNSTAITAIIVVMAGYRFRRFKIGDAIVSHLHCHFSRWLVK